MSLYHYPRILSLLLFLIVALGATALGGMPRLEDPHLQGRFAMIFTYYPGASADRVESLVSEVIEKKMREESGVKVVTSTSRDGVSVVGVELADAVDDVAPVMSRLRDKLQEVNNLPPETSSPYFDDKRIYAMTAIVGLSWVGEGPINYALLGRHAKELENRLSSLSGTNFTHIHGLPNEQILVEVTPSKLASHGLRLRDVANRLRASDVNAGGGVLSGDSTRLSIQVAGEFNSLERIRDVTLKAIEGAGVVRLGDVADVRRGVANPPGQVAYLDGRYGVLVSANMHHEQRVDIWSEKAKAVLENYQAGLPTGVRAELVFDQSKYSQQRLSNLMGNLSAGVAVVLTVLIITLGWRAAVVAGAILPLASLSALSLLHFNGYQIHQMTVTGLIVGLGIMVDNAIVLTDSIQTMLLKGATRAEAVARTIRKFWMPLLGATSTTIIAFMPILIMEGPAGEFVGGISAAVIATLIASYFISLAIISALAGRIVKGKTDEEKAAGDQFHRSWWREGIELPKLSELFRSSVRRAIKCPRRAMILASALPLLGLIVAGQLHEQFFPAGERDQFGIRMILPSHASIEDTVAMVEKADALMREDPRVSSIYWNMGGNFPKYYYNLMSNNDNSPHFAEAMVTTTSVRDAADLVGKFQPLLNEKLPHAQTLVRKLEQGPPIEAPIEVRVQGPDFAVLHRLGEQIRAELAQVPRVTHTNTRLVAGTPRVLVAPREDALATLGMSAQSLADQLQTMVDGIPAGRLVEESHVVPVMVRLDKASRNDLSALRKMDVMPERPIANKEDYYGVPLTAVADISLEPVVATIPRRDGMRLNVVQGFIEREVLAEEIFPLLRSRMEKAGVVAPAGYTIDFGGEEEKRNDAVGNLMAKAGLLGVLMVIAIVLTFNSFRLAAVTFASAIQAAGLGLLCLYVSGYPLGFVVIVGMMGLVGLAINAAIVILTELKSDPKACAGDEEAIVHGVMSTSRHIISTTLTTLGGFLPLILAGGKFWPPFAIPIAGGAFLSMLVSFYFAPAAFAWFTNRKAFKQNENRT